MIDPFVEPKALRPMNIGIATSPTVPSTFFDISVVRYQVNKKKNGKQEQSNSVPIARAREEIITAAGNTHK
jgi:hypothetical protein